MSHAPKPLRDPVGRPAGREQLPETALSDDPERGMMRLPATMTPEYLADLAIDNGEGAAQAKITDKFLRESLVLNVRTQMQRLVDWYSDGSKSK
jgi:hypothetical protein